MENQNIISRVLNALPYRRPFLFVDEIMELNESHITGIYTFPADSFFYNGHFTHKPVTPGVILLETLGQTGLVCFGIYLLRLYQNSKPVNPVLTSIEADFRLPVYPGETVTVTSEKIYLRKSILKCSLKMTNSKSEEIVFTKAICKFV